MSQSKYRQLDVRAPRGTTLTAKSWLTEAPLRMLMNNLDAEVAEKPHELVVYGGIGRAARTWEAFDRIVASLKSQIVRLQYRVILLPGRPALSLAEHRRIVETICAQ